MTKYLSTTLIVLFFLFLSPSVIEAARLDIASPKDPQSLMDVQTDVLNRLRYREEQLLSLRANVTSYQSLSSEASRYLLSRVDNLQNSLENAKTEIRSVESVSAVKSEVFSRQGGIRALYSEMPLSHGLFIGHQVAYLLEVQQTSLERLEETMIRIEAGGNDISALNNLKLNVEDLIYQLEALNESMGMIIEDSSTEVLNQQMVQLKQLLSQIQVAWGNLQTEVQRYF